MNFFDWISRKKSLITNFKCIIYLKRFVCISTNCRSDHNLLIFFSQKKSLIEQEVPVAGKWSVLKKKTRIDMKIDPFRNIYDIAKKKIFAPRARNQSKNLD